MRDAGLEKFLEGAKLAVRQSPVSAQEPSTVCVEEGTLEALRVYLAAGDGADGKGLGGVDVEVDALAPYCVTDATACAVRRVWHLFH